MKNTFCKSYLKNLFYLYKDYSQQQEYFFCDFDGTNTLTANVCGGAIVTPTLLPPVALSSTVLDIFNGVTITDVTSIRKIWLYLD